ncbi:MAG: prepilin-type N-terminal cleavage/methylation domain-containing protein [Verrucomicrobiia bacterium]|jgi:prepilin-type N-terminal cleavage/methylation domain-containing protein
MSMNCTSGGAARPSTRLRQGFGGQAGSGQSAAFTLIELMASMAILGLIMVMLFSVFEQVNKAWLSGENRVETFTQARAILDLMSRELSQAIATAKVPFYAKDLKNIYFVAPVNPAVGSAAVDLCEVGYEFNDVITLVHPLATLTRRFSQSTDPQWDFYQVPGTWWQSFNAANDAILADGSVLSVTFRCYDVSGNPVPLPYDSTAHLNRLPYTVVISMDAVDSRTLTKLKLINNVGTAWQSITNAALRTFSATVYLPNTRP